MQSLPPPLAPLGAFRQFVAYRLVPSRDRPGKTDKFPLDGSGKVAGASDPAALCDFDEAVQRAATVGPAPGSVGHGVGFTLTATDPFFFLDVDGALGPDGSWSPLAVELCSLFQGAAVEVSQSGRGLHILGTGTCLPHGCRNQQLGLELYTEARFVALTGRYAQGSALADCSQALALTVPKHFPPPAHAGADWTDGPVRGGVPDDAELLDKALRSRSAASAFGAKASFAQLWGADEDALAAVFPDPDRPYDASGADAALAQHLAFWTGGDCERVVRLMRESALVRDKWEREDYLVRTVSRACGLQKNYYEPPPVEVSPAEQAAGLTGSAAEKKWAESIRTAKLAEVTDPADRDRLAAKRSARYWIDNRDADAQALAVAARPIEAPRQVMVAAVQEREGFQYMPAAMQKEHFRQCVYVQSEDKVLAPSGAWLDERRFKATYGGYEFQLSGDKTTKNAWEAFLQSQVLRWPIAEAACFRPELPFQAFVDIEGARHVNTYLPAPVRRVASDPGPLLRHLELLLPDAGDRAIALAYMAACVQRVGIKFQWAPLFQGCEGNGKSLLTRCVAYAVGERYTHYPDADDLANKFNKWLVGKILIGVEDVYVPEHKADVMNSLKPKITNRRQGIQGKGADQVSAEVCANFILNSNYRDAIRKSESDRRFAVFYTGQQSSDDLVRDGMSGDYFPNLYRWLDADGYAIVAEYLATYPIPAELDPAGACHRAPATSTTAEAVESSLGSVEQEVLEAIEEGMPGFRGGWISSMSLDGFLQGRRLAHKVPQNKRREMLKSIGYDWHPGLASGRAPSMVPMHGGKPRLFVKAGSAAAALTGRPTEIVEAYVKAQGVESFPAPTGVASVA